MGRKVKESTKLVIGSLYSTKYYGFVEVVQDQGCRNVTVKFLDTGYIRDKVNRGNILRGNVKDPSVKARHNDQNQFSGENTQNSYLAYMGKIKEREHKYFCKLCNKENITVKKYSESNIPLSCGCIGKLKPKVKDLTGLVIEGIQVIGYVSDGKWRVRFSCGHSYDLLTATITGRSSSECRNCTVKSPTTLDHGHAKRSGYSPEYTSWLNMRRRCEDDGHNRYEFYKGKGITYPEEWRDFNVFLEDMGHKPDNSHSIERLDRDAPYSKSNCIWASSKTQANNKSNNILIIKEGETLPMSLKHWCDLEGINYKNAHYRFKKKGESVEDILGVNYSLETP